MTAIKISSAIDLGSVIRKRRKSLRMRIDDTASVCEVAVSTLSALENGSRPVGTDSLFKVLRGLGIELVVTDRGMT